MHQDNLDNKIKDIFGSMDDYDREEAQSRKEQIWQTVNTGKDKNRVKRGLLVLLLSLLFFAAGWFLRNEYTAHIKSIQKEQPVKPMPADKNQQAIAQVKKQLRIKEQQLDSLHKTNKILSAKLAVVATKKNEANAAETKVHTIYVKDTFYITELKIEQQVVEKIIRDTILLEVPTIEQVQPEMAEANVEDPKNTTSSDQTAEAFEPPPSSIQFNFSESNLRDK